MNKYIISLCMLILLAGSVNAWSENKFNNTLSAYSFESNDEGWTVDGFSRSNNWASDFSYSQYTNTCAGTDLMLLINFSEFKYVISDFNYSGANQTKRWVINPTCVSGGSGLTYFFPDLNTRTDGIVYNQVFNTSTYSGVQCLEIGSSCFTLGTGGSFNNLYIDNIRLMKDYDYQAVFTGNQNITRYLSVPSNTLLTNAYLNLTGNIYNLTDVSNMIHSVHNSTTNEWTNNTGRYFYTPENSRDGDWDTNAYIESADSDYGNGTIWLNYTIPSNVQIANYTFKYLMSVPTFTAFTNRIITYCYNNTLNDFSEIQTLSLSNWGTQAGNSSMLFPNECVNSTKLQIKLFLKSQASGNAGNSYTRFYEGDLFYYEKSYPNNISLSIGNSIGFNQSGLFNYTNKTSNLATLINTYLGSCTYLNGYCNVPFNFHSDTSGIIIYNNLLFDNNGYVNNGEIYNSNTYETTTESFILNMTFDPNYYQSATANLIYNGSTYTSVKSTNGIYTIFNSTINIPLINVTTLNNSFYWSVVLANSSGNTYFNTSLHNQTVNQINLGICNGSTNILALNITAYNQDDLTSITNWNFKGTLNYYISNSSLSRVFNLTNLSIIEQNLCINANTTFRITGQLEYSVNNTYQTSNYYFVNQNISNSTTHLKLGILPITSTTVFIVKLLDQYNLPVNGYYINIDRYYPGLNEYRTVQTVKTDSNGQSVAFIEINNVQYRFVVKDSNGNIVYTSDTRVITPQSSPYTITINLVSSNPNVLSTNRTIRGLTWSVSFDKNSKIVTYAYADSNSSFTKSEFIVYQTTGNSNTVICATNLTTPNGVITCNLSNYTSGSFSAQAYVYRDVKYFVDNLLFDISNLNFGNLGIFGGICIILICAFAFSFNSLAGIASINIGIIAVNLLGLINFGWITISAIIAISIVIAIVLERD